MNGRKNIGERVATLEGKVNVLLVINVAAIIIAIVK